jgi:hypothetical protein
VAYIPVERYPWLETAWENHLSNFIRIKTLCDRSGAELLVVIIPPKEEVYRSLRHQPAAVQYDWDQPDRLARSYFERKGIPYFDLTPHFRRYADQTPRNRLDSVKDLYWRTDGHWNVRGNRLAGLLLAEYILTNSMINIDNPQEKKRATEDELKTLNPNYFS